MRNSKNKSVARTVPLRSGHCLQGGHSCHCCGCYDSQARIRLGWGHGPAGNLREHFGRTPKCSQVTSCPRKVCLSASPTSPSPDHPAVSPSHSTATPASVAEAKTLALSLTPLVLSNPTSNLLTNPLSSVQDLAHNLWGPVSNENGCQWMAKGY